MATQTAAQKKFSQLSQLKYKDQAIWFLNGFWGDGVDPAVATRVWEVVRKFIELDLLGGQRKGEEGNELDQFWSAKFLEDMDSAMPAIQRKEALRSIDHDNNGKMSTLEYLVWKYKKTIEETVDAPQGDNTEAIKKAQAALDAVVSQMSQCEQKLEHQKGAKAANEQAISELRSAEAALQSAEQELARAESELAAAVQDLEDQQSAYNNKITSLDKTSKDTSLSQVQRSKAANELAQLKGEDPLPLRKSKITQEAALRKVQKQKKATEEAKLQTQAKARDLEAKGRELQKAIQELEDAYAQLEVKMVDAEKQLEAIKNKPGGGKGALWWLQRELFELDKRLPTSKQKFNHNQPFNYTP